MTIVVFCGPTIPEETVAHELDATIRPPAQRGDILRASLERPHAILLIDGYFHRVPSVWHKEILWALSKGIHVFGASSMGALRAAELAVFGMVGIGEIFRAFLTGELEDDDEVAVAHGDADSGYRLGCDAMVNIRWTLRAAERQGVIRPTTRLELESRAKALPYEQRHLRLVLNGGGVRGLPESELASLRDWLPGGGVDQKRLDAVAALRHVAALDREGWRPKSVEFQFSETDGWTKLRAAVEGVGGDRDASTRGSDIEEELRARGLLGRTLAGATMRLLAAERLRREAVNMNGRAVESWIDDFRRGRGLLSEASFDAWLDEAGLEGDECEAFFRREAVVRATRVEFRHALAAAIEDDLRATGDLSDVRTCAMRKRSVLAARGMSVPTLQDVNVTEDELWRWFFCASLRVPVPRSIGVYAAAEGSTVEELRATALRALAFSGLDKQAHDLVVKT